MKIEQGLKITHDNEDFFVTAEMAYDARPQLEAIARVFVTFNDGKLFAEDLSGIRVPALEGSSVMFSFYIYTEEEARTLHEAFSEFLTGGL